MIMGDADECECVIEREGGLTSVALPWELGNTGSSHAGLLHLPPLLVFSTPPPTHTLCVVPQAFSSPLVFIAPVLAFDISRLHTSSSSLLQPSLHFAPLRFPPLHISSLLHILPSSAPQLLITVPLPSPLVLPLSSRNPSFISKKSKTKERKEPPH